jgi:hypothetical protein
MPAETAKGKKAAPAKTGPQAAKAPGTAKTGK